MGSDGRVVLWGGSWRNTQLFASLVYQETKGCRSASRWEQTLCHSKRCCSAWIQQVINVARFIEETEVWLLCVDCWCSICKNLHTQSFFVSFPVDSRTNWNSLMEFVRNLFGNEKSFINPPSLEILDLDTLNATLQCPHQPKSKKGQESFDRRKKCPLLKQTNGQLHQESQRQRRQNGQPQMHYFLTLYYWDSKFVPSNGRCAYRYI